ncbi:MAG: hypothetical protein HY657_12975 [Acidobacteria bacterium]|nr:hypothetical protein [Acidobacteriota bacterium]
MLRRLGWVVAAAACGALLSLWSRAAEDRSREEILALIRARLAADLALNVTAPDVLSIGGARPVAGELATMLLGNPYRLVVERREAGWVWAGVIAEEGSQITVDQLMRQLRRQNEQAAIDAIRVINTAQVASRIRAGRYAALDELAAAGLLVHDVRSRPPRGYRVELEADRLAYRVFATPAAYPRSGVRSFFSDETLAIRGADLGGQRAGAREPAID